MSFVDGIRTKAYFKSNKSESKHDGTYLSYYFGQPILIQTLVSSNEVVIATTSRDIWNDMQDTVIDMIQELTDGSAQLI